MTAVVTAPPEPDLARQRKRALAALRTGRVRLLNAYTPPTESRPLLLHAHVQSSMDNQVHVVEYEAPRWSCTCPEPGCPHVTAVQLCTGWA